MTGFDAEMVSSSALENEALTANRVCERGSPFWFTEENEDLSVNIYSANVQIHI